MEACSIGTSQHQCLNRRRLETHLVVRRVANVTVIVVAQRPGQLQDVERLNANLGKCTECVAIGTVWNGCGGIAEALVTGVRPASSRNTCNRVIEVRLRKVAGLRLELLVIPTDAGRE